MNASGLTMRYRNDILAPVDPHEVIEKEFIEIQKLLAYAVSRLAELRQKVKAANTAKS